METWSNLSKRFSKNQLCDITCPSVYDTIPYHAFDIEGEENTSLTYHEETNRKQLGDSVHLM